MTEITSHVKVSYCQSDSNLSKSKPVQFPNHFVMVCLLLLLLWQLDLMCRIKESSRILHLHWFFQLSKATTHVIYQQSKNDWSFCKMKQAHLFLKDWKKYFQGYFNFHSGTPKMPQNVWNLLPVHIKTKNNHPHSTVSREVARRGGGGKGNKWLCRGCLGAAQLTTSELTCLH